jgi:CubicO group peptidase (beta-lactamase class C family)
MSPERIERIGRLCGEWVEQGSTTALQVLVARRGTIVLHGAWGRQGPGEDAPPLGMDAIFPLASITKPFTATAIMCLLEDGLLGLNRPVQEYVPEFVGEGKEAVMVHHLLTHTSGLRNDAMNAHAAEKIRAGRIAAPEPVTGFGPEEFLHAQCFDDLHNAPLSKAPGEEMSYCNYGYRLLAEIVTRVSGQPTECFVQKRILDPLGMVSTSYAGLPPERRDRLVGSPPTAPYRILSQPDAIGFGHGMGSAYSTALDLTAFGQMFLNRGVYGGARVLGPVTVAEMTRNQIPGVSSLWAGEFFPEASWGYGWDVLGNKKSARDTSLLSGAAFGHGGSGMTKLWADPVYDVVIVYLSIATRMVTPRKSDWSADLFINAAMASIVD